MTKKTPSPFSPSAQSGRGPRENRTRRNAPTLETPAAGNSGTGSSGPGNSGPRNSGSGALKRCDIVIAGGGMVGLTLAIALGQSGLKVVIIDRDTPERLTAADADGRASAIAYGSQRLLDVLGIWPRIKEIGPIREIRVADGKLAGPQGGLTAAELFIHYDVAELHPKTTLRSHGSPAAIAKPRAKRGDDDTGPPPGVFPEAFGWMVENRFLREALFARLKELPSITVMMPNRIKDKTIDDYGVHLTLAGGETFRCALLVAAEGRTSSLRHDAGIEVMAWNYPQTAIVATLGHEYPHHEIALETFLPAGPFAVLPLAGGCRSSIVWTERDRLAKDYLALSESAFAAEIRRRVGDHLGRLEVLGSRFSHPVGLSLAKQIAAQRLALIGDAAHAIHPIAGQGLNLALRGIASLAEIVVETARLGLDLGSPEVLHRYETSRRADTLALALVTDGLNRLFSTDRAPLRLLRDLGMGAVNQTPFLKRIFMRHAMGMRDGMTRAALGELPRLIRGEAL